jgi:hypothetical protein
MCSRCKHGRAEEEKEYFRDLRELTQAGWTGLERARCRTEWCVLGCAFGAWHGSSRHEGKPVSGGTRVDWMLGNRLEGQKSGESVTPWQQLTSASSIPGGASSAQQRGGPCREGGDSQQVRTQRLSCRSRPTSRQTVGNGVMLFGKLACQYARHSETHTFMTKHNTRLFTRVAKKWSVEPLKA